MKKESTLKRWQEWNLTLNASITMITSAVVLYAMLGSNNSNTNELKAYIRDTNDSLRSEMLYMFRIAADERINMKRDIYRDLQPLDVAEFKGLYNREFDLMNRHLTELGTRIRLLEVESKDRKILQAIQSRNYSDSVFIKKLEKENKVIKRGE